MLSGVKFIPREEIDQGKNEKKSGSSRKEKKQRRKESSSSSDEVEKIEKLGRKKKKKWYSSEEYSSESESESGSEDSLDRTKRKRRRGKKKRSKSSRKHYSSEESSGDDGRKDRSSKGSQKDGKKKDAAGNSFSGDDRGDGMTVQRKEMGLDWMLRPKEPTNADKMTPMTVDDQQEEAPTEEIKKTNPRELNPYLKDNGSGYPEEADGVRADDNRLLSSKVVGDGGASWRLKALKRAQEQAAREGRKLDEVVEERWGSVGQLAVSAASHRAAPSRSHLHAIRSRQKGQDKESERHTEKNAGRDYLPDVSLRHRDMKAPKIHDKLSWGKRKMSNEDAGVISAAVASLNKFSNDGSFLHEVQKQSDGGDGFVDDTNSKGKLESELVILESEKPSEDNALVKEGLSANQLAAKALQLRMKGKHEEAEKLMQEADRIKARQQENSIRPGNERSTSRLFMKDMSSREKKKEDDADVHLARKIMQNKQYSMLGRADDEYDFEDGPSRKSRKKGGGDDRKIAQQSSFATRIMTQQERCLFCFENPNRPKHLVVSIANFTYLMLPQWQSVVPGHCCILTTQHESSTRSVDNNVWDEIRNFKKCLIMMFAKQEKELVFLETVMGLAQQRRHCLIDCIPLPRDIAKEAPLYFKKAIDEAEDEWSQHNAKKLIDTSVKGLRGSIPKDFPYFHVEFGLNKGFVHVIDDEKQFKSSLGRNVIRGMLELAEEDMYRRRRQESVETQKQAVTSFAREWEPFDWTKQLE